MDLDPSVTRRGRFQVVVALTSCTLIGGIMGYLLIDTDWTDTRKIVVGVFLGFWCGLMISARRLMM